MKLRTLLFLMPVFLLACRKDIAVQPDVTPSPTPTSVPDPRDAYCGNYAFNVHHHDWTYLSQTWNDYDVQDSGYIRKEDSVHYYIIYGAYDSIMPVVFDLQHPDMISYFNYAPSSGGFTDTSHLNFSFIKSRSPNFEFDVTLTGAKY